MATDLLNVPENPAKGFNKYFRFKLGRDSPSDARNTLHGGDHHDCSRNLSSGDEPSGGSAARRQVLPTKRTVVTSDNNCTIIRHAGDKRSILSQEDEAMNYSSPLTRWPSLRLPPPSIICYFGTAPYRDERLCFALAQRTRVWCCDCCCAPSKTI
ncbi:hypothetical protein OIU84_025109 [Salix udensis]|uniref:Uncharacterized protein n=1 Tax=Salix udensis TaxID=889485 RepID=A0AAD6PBF6_9ROSI|nr:hypothetical protein OIU84_025109 [Salix udensis]